MQPIVKVALEGTGLADREGEPGRGRALFVIRQELRESSINFNLGGSGTALDLFGGEPNQSVQSLLFHWRNLKTGAGLIAIAKEDKHSRMYGNKLFPVKHSKTRRKK
jgi:hypothetical protein